MSALVKQLASYAEYHRDGRNVATHLVGIPMIVLAVEILLSRPQWPIGSLTLSPAFIASAAAALFYVGLDVAFGLAMSVLLGVAAWIGLRAAGLPTGAWIAAGLGSFVAGWIIQFVGHGFEGRKPALLDDLTSLLIGPLFVVAEIAFAAGYRRELKKAIDASRARIAA